MLEGLVLEDEIIYFFRSEVVKGWGWLLFVRQFPVASVRDSGMQLLLEDLG